MAQATERLAPTLLLPQTQLVGMAVRAGPQQAAAEVLQLAAAAVQATHMGPAAPVTPTAQEEQATRMAPVAREVLAAPTPPAAPVCLTALVVPAGGSRAATQWALLVAAMAAHAAGQKGSN